MNFLILNGKKSTEIAGLMIQSLPPITKPQMRIQMEQVDGRDGDIITPLGFAGYDRTVKIGLRGVYDEDQVIEYFNSSGKVIFSNEPDKVYDYTITSQFNLNRLRRFREADVVFHVQPFKHNAVKERAKISHSEGVNRLPLFIPATKEFELTDGTPLADTTTATIDAEGHIYINGSVTLTSKDDVAEVDFYLTEPSVPPPVEEEYLFSVYVSGTYLHPETISDRPKFPIVRLNVLFSDGSNQPLPIRKPGWYKMPVSQNQSISGIGVVILFNTTATTMDSYTATFGDFSVTHIWVIDESAPTDYSIQVRNDGNVESAPTFSVTANSEISISVNGGDPVTIEPDDTDAVELSIDTDKMQAVNIDGTLANRRCTGDYNNLRLKPGYNTVSYTGEILDAEVDNYSRWI